MNGNGKNKLSNIILPVLKNWDFMSEFQVIKSKQTKSILASITTRFQLIYSVKMHVLSTPVPEK